jgi:steroid delta-isomerase-like uncharacterized protein
MPDSVTIAQTFFDAWNARDFERGVKLAADDLEIIEVPADETFRGPGGLRQEYEKWANGLPDGEVDINNAVGGDEWVAFECVIRGTNTGPFVTPMGEIAPTGRTVKIPFSTFLQIRGGKVAKVRHYYDIASLMSQLGISPEVMAGATA